MGQGFFGHAAHLRSSLICTPGNRRGPSGLLPSFSGGDSKHYAVVAYRDFQTLASQLCCVCQTRADFRGSNAAFDNHRFRRFPAEIFDHVYQLLSLGRSGPTPLRSCNHFFLIDINDFHDNIPHMFDFYSNHIISGYYRVLSFAESTSLRGEAR